MEIEEILKKIYLPAAGSHKGQNGRLLIIGGSKLFHAASLWALQVASRIADLVHYSSVPEDNKLVAKLKKEFRNGIVIPRSEIENYIEEDDCILIGPGMVRSDAAEIQSRFNRDKIQNLTELEQISDEGIQTYVLTKYLLEKYNYKKWVIDAGSLQMIEPQWIPAGSVLTPNQKEYQRLFGNMDPSAVAKKFNCVIVYKLPLTTVCSPDRCIEIKGGNAGLTKGGTGDVQAGLTVGLLAKNDPFLAASAASFVVKKAADELYKRVGTVYNADDLAIEIPKVFSGI